MSWPPRSAAKTAVIGSLFHNGHARQRFRRPTSTWPAVVWRRYAQDRELLGVVEGLARPFGTVRMQIMDEDGRLVHRREKEEGQ
jgi:hypothetical protein